jgi:hypothetical protein
MVLLNSNVEFGKAVISWGQEWVFRFVGISAKQ